MRGNPEATVSTPIRWDEVDDAEPRDLTIATVPARYAELGDLHAGIDDAVFDLAPLLEWADRDERDGAETPDLPEDCPSDRQAVPGEVVTQRRLTVVDVPLLGEQPTARAASTLARLSSTNSTRSAGAPSRSRTAVK